MTDLPLTPKEFDGLFERLGPTHQARARTLTHDLSRYEIELSPITFFVDRCAYERHLLQALVAHFSSKWKDVLTEPTLVTLRALLAAAPLKSPPTRPDPPGVVGPAEGSVVQDDTTTRTAPGAEEDD